MSALEEKKIVIKLPSFHFRALLNGKFFAFLALVAIASAGGYWYQKIRPWLWIASAHVESPCAVISSDLGGRIAEIGAREGDAVRKGQMLFALDRDLLFAKQAQAKLRIDAIDEQIEREKERMGKAMEDYVAASTELELGVGSADLVKKQLALMDEAQQKSDEARSQLVLARAELDLLNLQLKKMTLAAPFDGVILKSSKNLGAVVSFGEPIFVLADPNQVWIETEVPENKIGRIGIGTPVRIQLPAYPNKEFSGKVSWISPAGQGRTIPVKISLENPGVILKPGLSAQVALKICP